MLSGARVALGPMVPADHGTVFETDFDVEHTELGGRHGRFPGPEARARDLELMLKAPDEASFAMLLKPSLRAIGFCGLRSIDHRNESARVFIGIHPKALWGRGYGREAMRLLCDYAFNVLSLHSLRLNVFGFNERAIRSYKAVGFREAARLRESVQRRGRLYDDVLMDILDREFRRRHRSVVPPVAAGGAAGRRRR
jgi:RimJ/RimL family protein N-acetyltransferase